MAYFYWLVQLSSDWSTYINPHWLIQPNHNKLIFSSPEWLSAYPKLEVSVLFFFFPPNGKRKMVLSGYCFPWYLQQELNWFDWRKVSPVMLLHLSESTKYIHDCSFTQLWPPCSVLSLRTTVSHGESILCLPLSLSSLSLYI